MRDKVATSLTLAAGAMLPEESSVYEWCYDQEGRQWVQWMSTIPEFKCDPDKPFSEVRHVPMTNALRLSLLCNSLPVVVFNPLAVIVMRGKEKCKSRHAGR